MNTSIIENDNMSVRSYLSDLKRTTSIWEDVVTKASKLDQSIRSMSQSTNNISDSIRMLCAPRHNFSGLDKVTQLLLEVTTTEKYLGQKMTVLSKAVQNNLVNNISREMESWRRSISIMKKEREIEGRKAKIVYKKSLAEVTKLEKKINKQSDRKQSLSDTMSVQVDYASQDLQNKERLVDELDRCVLRKAICEERNRYRILVESLRPVLEAQLSIRDDLDQLQRIYTELYSTPHFDLSSMPCEVETYVQQFQVSDRSRTNSFCSVYSRTNSQQSLGGSNCSSPRHIVSPPPYCSDNIDTSSSTLHDKFNESEYQLDIEKDDDGSDVDDGQYSCSTEKDTIVDQTTLYPNQALPAPRYSNLRQLKQNADKKYGLSTLTRNKPLPYSDNQSCLWNTPSQYNDLILPKNKPSCNGDYRNLPRTVTSSNYADDNILYRSTNSYNNVNEKLPYRNTPSSQCENYTFNTLPQSNLNDGTLTRSSTHSSDLSNHQIRDNDVYSSISEIYGAQSIFSDVNSGTSTFKRRKPSNVTAMEAPRISDKDIYQTIPCRKPHPSKEVDSTTVLSIDIGRGNTDLSTINYGPDLTNLSGFPLARTRPHNDVCYETHNDVIVTRRPSTQRDGRRFSDVLDSGTKHGDALPFKQQLLHLIQTGRPPYPKPMSSVSSHIF